MQRIIALLAIVCLALETSAVDQAICVPSYKTTKIECDAKIQPCIDEWGVTLEWTGQGTWRNGKLMGDGGCQCFGYCGYFSATPCNRDRDCSWNGKKRKCYYKKPYRPGFPMPRCPTKSPTRPPSAAATKSPTPETVETPNPTTESPVSKAPTTDSPVSNAPTTDSPVSKAPTTDSPVSKAPTTDSPVSKAPTTDSPVSKAPTTDSPVSNAPTTYSPVSKAPTTAAPVAAETPAPTPEVIVTNAPTPKKCESETGWIKAVDESKAYCWQAELNKWGWSNGPYCFANAPVSYTFKIWLGAGQCDTSKGTYGGTVTLTVNPFANVIIAYAPAAGITFVGDVKAYIGKDEIGDDKAAPGQMPIKVTSNPYTVPLVKLPFAACFYFYVHFDGKINCT